VEGREEERKMKGGEGREGGGQAPEIFGPRTASEFQEVCIMG